MGKSNEVRNQRKDVLQYLKTHKRGLTQMDAYTKFPAPITRLSAVVFDLRKQYDIVSVDVEGKNCSGDYRCVRYVLKGELEKKAEKQAEKKTKKK